MIRYRRHARWSSPGMTLVEIMIVVIIMALIATGVAFAVIPAISDGREQQTRIDVITIHNAVAQYMIQHYEECPESIEQLSLSRAARRTDAWNRPFEIRCEDGQEPLVTSAGRDGELGTADDILSVDDGADQPVANP